MKVPQSPIAAYGIVVAFVVVPVGIAIAVASRSGGSLKIGQPTPYLWFLAAVAVVIGVSLLSRESRLRTHHSGPAGVRTAYALVRLEMLGYSCFVIAEFLLVVAIDRLVGAVFLGLAALWTLVWAPHSNRKVVVHAAIEVRCTPAAAFDLLTDPNNWQRYIPDIEIVKPLEMPLRVGSVIHARVRREGFATLDADEEVILLEPGRRFGTAIRDAPNPSTGTYELQAIAGGTKIEYTYRSAVPLPSAILGVGLTRRDLVKRMSARRSQAMDRLKRLLEEPAPTSV